MASGQVGKARDILAAIRTLKAIEQDGRAATADEKQALARFSGFGPVALSIFPEPTSGRYKDATWRLLGEELKQLLTPDEYDSAKRTTFNAFYTSPEVIDAIHQAIVRLGLFPMAGHCWNRAAGWAISLARESSGSRFIGVEMDSISGRIARALYPQADIRIENFRDSKLPEGRIDAVIGNVPFADVKMDYRGQKYALHDYFFAKSVDALKARRRPRPGYVALHPRQAKRRLTRVPFRAGRFRRRDPLALECVQAGRDRRGDRHRVSSQAGTGGASQSR